LAASETETYDYMGECLNRVDNPLTFDLPENYEYGFVLLYAYCGQASDSIWDGNFIDLRTTKTKVATGLPDLSIFLTRDGSRTLTDNWNVGKFNITNISYLQALLLNVTGTKLEVNGIIRTTPRSSVICDSTTEGGIYYDSDDRHFYGCNSTDWVQLDN